MNVQFKKGALEMVVLLAIKKEDQYGYALVQKISERIIIAEGSIYPLLRRLVKEEYLITYLVVSTEGPSRKYYSITKKGELFLKQLVNEWEEFSDAVNVFVKENETDD